jgi:hypothetical protein
MTNLNMDLDLGSRVLSHKNKIYSSVSMMPKKNIPDGCSTMIGSGRG